MYSPKYGMCYLDSWKIDPQIVCVENVELFDRLEILNVVLGNLGYFQQPQMILKLKSFGAVHQLRHHILAIFRHPSVMPICPKA